MIIKTGLWPRQARQTCKEHNCQHHSGKPTAHIDVEWFDESARQDVMALLSEIERLERELALAKMNATSRAGRVPR